MKPLGCLPRAVNHSNTHIDLESSKPDRAQTMKPLDFQYVESFRWRLDSESSMRMDDVKHHSTFKVQVQAYGYDADQDSLNHQTWTGHDRYQIIMSLAFVVKFTFIVRGHRLLSCTVAVVIN